MVRLVVLALVLLPSLSAAQVLDEREVRAPTTETLVERVSYWPGSKGGKVLVKQVFIKNPDGSLIYRYDRQPVETQQFHRAYCRARGAEPSRGDGILRGPNAIGGLSCSATDSGNGQSGVGVGSKAEPMGQSDRRSSHGDLLRAAEYVITAAPDGLYVPANQNFQLQGDVLYSSAKAGQISSTIIVDSRCSYEQSDPVAANAAGRIEISVTCIVYEKRKVPTRINACIPYGCSSDEGSVTTY